MRNIHIKGIVTSLFLLILSAVLLYLTLTIIREPFIGLEVRENGGKYFVEAIEPAGQAIVKGIAIGDEIVEVNGKAADEYHYLNKFFSVEKAQTVLVMHNDGTPALVSFSKGWNGEHSASELLIQLYLPLISLVLFTGLSTFLYRKRKDDRAALMLMLFFVIIGLSYYSSAASYRSDLVGYSIMYVALPFIPSLFLLFMNSYLKRYDVDFISKSWMIGLFGISGIVQLGCLIYVWTDLIPGKIFLFIRMIYYGTLLVGNFLCIVLLIKKYLFYRNTKLNSLFKITLTSHIVAFTPFTVMNVLPLFFGYSQILPAAFTAPFLFVLPVVYFYLLTSNQLFDIDFILSRFRYYTSLAIIPAIIITFVLTAIMKSQSSISWIMMFQIFTIVYIGITLFLYVKEQIDHKFRPKLFKSMYSYQDSLDRFSRKIARVMKRADLEEVLKQELNELLPVNRIDFLLVDQAEAVVKPIGETAEEQGTAIFLLQVSETLKVGEMVELPHGLGLVMGRQRSKYHIVWIGSKTNHTRFNSDELRWLKTMANYASIVFENLYLIEGLIEDLESEVQKEQTTSPWVLRLLFCLSENERRKLAADLHDSALQDQLLWYRKLESLIMDHPLSDKLGQELEDIKEGLLDVIHQIRETCNELRPPLLKEMGVVEAVESIVEHSQMRDNFAIDFRPKMFHRELNEEQITAIYRIVQELLRNAAKHAQANLVTLELEQRKDEIYFRYVDDGKGMDVDYMKASFEHMGLSGIKERVTSLEGEISFRSKLGNGLEVVISLPETITTGRSERGLMRDSYLIG
ncbi:ATP-binding protein [Paenibacillus sp. NEAU-GSW1]|uniref:ATP-binding protein n=1 Tax=Paenibacillus sp. NEAU-GSW1 TaxID=2682486 RepID=UPI0012E2BAAF|nr:ATP-binding protein [Paenibacillus sp. NEAU-GSW1]MUT67871.1 histidine kinase [Paenibacillus sp. NEAU-GSW1]